MLLTSANNGRSSGRLTALIFVLGLGLGLHPEKCAGVVWCDSGQGSLVPGKSLDDLKRQSVRSTSCPLSCFNYTLDVSPTRKEYRWGCSNQMVSDCFLNKGFAVHDCHILSSPRSSFGQELEKGKCIDQFLSTQPPPSARSTGSGQLSETLCLCKKDLCNQGASTKVVTKKTTTARTVTEGGKTETTTVGTEVPENTEATSRRPKKRRHSVPKEARFVMYFGIVLVSLFALASCYLFLCLDRKWNSGQKRERGRAHYMTNF